VSLLLCAGGAESFDGSGLLSGSGLRLVESPMLGVGLLECCAAVVLGLERVPRTEVEWDVFTIVAGSRCRCRRLGWMGW